MPASIDVRRGLIDREHETISIYRQCELLDLPRSTFYYRPATETDENLHLMRLLDEQYMKTPFYGSRKMVEALKTKDHVVNRKRVQRLMRIMGIQALAPRRCTSRPGKGHRVFPYLLRQVEITHPDHVWSVDITYIPLLGGYVYLVAIIDWYSRYVLAWRLSNRLDGSFCLEALDEALKGGKPEIFNSDQGSQFTSLEFTSRLLDHAVAISMDGRGRALDNVFIERFWRSLKYEDIYLKEYRTVDELYEGLVRYFFLYNHERFHQALDYQTPYRVYHWGLETAASRNRGNVRRRPPLKASAA